MSADERVIEVLTRLRADRDGNRQPLDYYRRWAEVEADALAQAGIGVLPPGGAE